LKDPTIFKIIFHPLFTFFTNAAAGITNRWEFFIRLQQLTARGGCGIMIQKYQLRVAKGGMGGNRRACANTPELATSICTGFQAAPIAPHFNQGGMGGKAALGA
jgi:hypothetical protein